MIAAYIEYEVILYLIDGIKGLSQFTKIPKFAALNHSPPTLKWQTRRRVNQRKVSQRPIADHAHRYRVSQNEIFGNVSWEGDSCMMVTHTA
jgi:hypothetical protein